MLHGIIASATVACKRTGCGPDLSGRQRGAVRLAVRNLQPRKAFSAYRDHGCSSPAIAQTSIPNEIHTEAPAPFSRGFSLFAQGHSAPGICVSRRGRDFNFRIGQPSKHGILRHRRNQSYPCIRLGRTISARPLRLSQRNYSSTDPHQVGPPSGWRNPPAHPIRIAL